MRYSLCFLGLLPLFLAGCKREQATPPPQGKTEVKVSLPVVKTDVIDYEYFTGHTEAFKRVEIKARVTGHLEEINFKDGQMVEEDKLLFIIDQKPFKAQVAKAKADFKQAEARVKRFEADFARAASLRRSGGGSQEEYDLARGNRDEAIAGVGSAKATVDLAEQNLLYSEIKAPFAGRISRRLIDKGNLVKSDDTILSTIVTLDPMYAYFDVDERTLLRQLMSKGALDTARSGKVSIEIGMADEEGYPHPGTVDFVDNMVDTNTGTMWMRALFDKPKDGTSLRTISPGMFIRVRFPVGQPYRAVLVAEQAITTDQGQKFVYVLDNKDQVQYRQVTVGRLDAGLRVIKSDLKPTERIVVSGLQRVRANMEVKPEVLPMPVRTGSTTTPATGVGKDSPVKKSATRDE